MSLHRIFQGVLFFLLIYSPVAGHAQVTSPNFEQYSIKNGLPSQQIYHCRQDRNGFLWIGTDAGVSRFDGRKFVNFTVKDGLGDNEIHNIYEDTYGRIWFVPFNGKLTYYYKQRFYEQNIDVLVRESSHGRRNNIVFKEDGKGGLYISKLNSSKVILIQGLNSKSIVFDLGPYLKSNETFAAFHLTAGGAMHCLTGQKRLFILQKGNIRDVTPAHFLESFGNCTFNATSEKSHLSLIFYCEEGIFQLRNFSPVLLIEKSRLPNFGNSEPPLIDVDEYENIWVSHSEYNLVLFRKINSKYQQPVRILKHIYTTVTFDNEHNIWLSSSNGLFKTSYDKINDQLEFNINESLLDVKITACHTDIDGGYWLGYSNGYVTRFFKEKTAHYSLNIFNHTNNRIIQIRHDPAGNIYIATDETAVLLKRRDEHTYLNTSEFTNSKGERLRSPVKGFFFGSKGDIFITDPFATTSVRLDSYKQQYICGEISNYPASARRFSCFFDREGNFYHSAIEGFSVISKGVLNCLSTTDQRLNVRVQDYAQAANGTIFLATYNNGILALRSGKFVGEISSVNGASIICKRIYMRSDTLYAATNAGIVVLLFNRNCFEVLNVINVFNGLISDDVNDITVNGNELLAATSQGVSLFTIPFTEFSAAETAPVLLPGKIETDEGIQLPEKLSNLSYRNRLIRIEFTAPVITHPELVVYRYRLSAEQSWQLTSSPYIEFSAINPGEYLLEVQAKKQNSNWSRQLSFTIIIKPPFYKTVWFAAAGTLCISVLLILLIRQQLRRRFRTQLQEARQRAAIERERNRIAADLHDDIGAEITTIALLTMALRTRISPDDQTERILQNVKQATDLVISKMNEVIWTLSDKNDTLGSLLSYIRNYISSVRENSSMKIQVLFSEQINDNQKITAELRRNIYLSVKEIVQNTVKHAMADEFILKAEIKENLLLISCFDNGKGFDMNTIERRNGISNIEKRMKDVNGNVQFESHPGKGTAVTIKINLNT